MISHLVNLRDDPSRIGFELKKSIESEHIQSGGLPVTTFSFRDRPNSSSILSDCVDILPVTAADRLGALGIGPFAYG